MKTLARTLLTTAVLAMCLPSAHALTPPNEQSNKCSKMSALVDMLTQAAVSADAERQKNRPDQYGYGLDEKLARAALLQRAYCNKYHLEVAL